MNVARLAALSVASVLLPVPLSAVNEEAAHAEARAEAAAVQNLTVETSLHILRRSAHLSPDYLSFLEEALASHHVVHRKHHNHHTDHVRFLRHRRHHSKQLRQAAAPGYAAVGGTVAMTSEQIKATAEKWDLTNQECCGTRKSLEATLEGIDEGIAQANGQASAAQGEILKANKMITENENKIPDEKDGLKSLKEECRAAKLGAERDMEAEEKNMEGLDNMKMTDCAGKAALLQCEHEDGESFLMLSHHTTQSNTSKAAHWKVPAVQRLLKDLASTSEKPQTRPVVFMQMEDHVNPHKCSMEANPECQQIRDRYLVMNSDCMDNIDEIKERQTEKENDCEASVESIEQNVNNQEAQLKQHQTALAEATADYNEAMETSRLENERRQRHITEMKDQAKKCGDAKGELIAQKNSLLKVRAEMLNMQGLKTFIQDCKVGDWTPGECSVPCGGGVRKLTREVLVYPVSDGAKCPLLEAEEACNTQHCPINCEMGEWGGWSACSAKCGGGVMERVRDTKRRAAHGGKPCGESEETQSCNPQSCDDNCKLTGWGGWSKCSKACDTGTTFKVRRVRKAATGGGKCPGQYSKKRYRIKPCNKQACLAEKDKDKSLKCNDKRDVVLLLDGSASLRASGWDTMKKAAEAFVKAMGADVNVAVLLFSGPKTRTNYFKCTGKRFRGKSYGAPDMANDCLMTWVQHFSTDKLETASKIKAMTWPRGSSFMTQAMSMAETEMDAGRADAQSVVVVMTVGNALNKRQVTANARRLRRKARLMFVGVTRGARQRLRKNGQKWASRPPQENIIYDDFKNGFKKSTINTVVSDMCPTIGMA